MRREETEMLDVPPCLYVTKRSPHNGNPTGIRRSSLPNFNGIVLDTGATKSVVGHLQAKAYLNKTGMDETKLKPSKGRFRFGDATHASLGILNVSLLRM